MLVLRRKQGQRTEIRHRSGEVIFLKVVAVSPGQVLLGFEDAPRNFEIERPAWAGAEAPPAGD